MASIQSLDFPTYLQNMVASVQARATIVLNLKVGSVLRSFLEAVASVAIWLQAQIAYVLTVARAATSVGPDLDSFVGDFGLTRLAAQASIGTLVFSRFTGTGQVVVPVGQPEQSNDGSQNFFVALDTSNAAYSATLGGYVMNSGTTSVSVPSQAVAAGAAGNVLANTITVITSSINGIDSVTNPAPFTGGLDSETDPALRTRFVAFINSLSKATKAAIQFAVSTVRQGIQYTLTENYATNGTYQPGFFYVVADDGTGSPTMALLNAVAAAVELVRGFTIQYAVIAPTVQTANVTQTIVAGPNYVQVTVAANVSVAITNFINNLGLGNSLPYTQLIAIAYSVPGVTNVESTLLNGGTSDITATAKITIKAGSVVIS